MSDSSRHRPPRYHYPLPETDEEAQALAARAIADLLARLDAEDAAAQAEERAQRQATLTQQPPAGSDPREP
jgi:hypothetical protein